MAGGELRRMRDEGKERKRDETWRREGSRMSNGRERVRMRIRCGRNRMSVGRQVIAPF